MSEISKYEEYKNKLQGVCDANSLVFTIKKDRYPVTLTIRPCGGVGEQLSMLEDAEGKGYRSPDAYIAFTYDEDGTIIVDPSGRFQISDALFNKIKNLFKKLCFFWLMYFFRDVIEKDSLRRGMMPVINEEDADDDLEEDDEEEDDEPRDDPETDVSEEAMIEEATKLVRVENKASVALLQRRMKIGYAQAARILDKLEELGVVGPFNGDEPRAVLPFDAPDDEAQ